MSKSNAAIANVIDLDAFRQKKKEEEERSNVNANAMQPSPMFVPVWFCWVPVWAPVT